MRYKHTTYGDKFTTHGYDGYEPAVSRRDHAIDCLMDDYDLSFDDAVERYEELLREINDV